MQKNCIESISRGGRPKKCIGLNLRLNAGHTTAKLCQSKTRKILILIGSKCYHCKNHALSPRYFVVTLKGSHSLLHYFDRPTGFRKHDHEFLVLVWKRVFKTFRCEFHGKLLWPSPTSKKVCQTDETKCSQKLIKWNSSSKNWSNFCQEKNKLKWTNPSKRTKSCNNKKKPPNIAWVERWSYGFGPACDAFDILTEA